jgi:hypothetical protein
MIAAMDTSRSAPHHQEYQHKQYNVGMDQWQATEYADSAFSRAESGSVSEPSPKPVPMSVAAHSDHVRSPMQMGVESQKSSHSMHQRTAQKYPDQQPSQQPFQSDRHYPRDQRLSTHSQSVPTGTVHGVGQLGGPSFPGVPSQHSRAQIASAPNAHPQDLHSQSHSHVTSASVQYSHVHAQQQFGLNVGTMVSGPAVASLPGMYPGMAIYGSGPSVGQFGTVTNSTMATGPSLGSHYGFQVVNQQQSLPFQTVPTHPPPVYYPYQVQYLNPPDGGFYEKNLDIHQRNDPSAPSYHHSAAGYHQR